MYVRLEAPKDPEDIDCVESDVLFEFDHIKKILSDYRDKLFNYVKTLQDDIQDEEKRKDKDFIENSLLILDVRLRAHWPMKGRLEVEVY